MRSTPIILALPNKAHSFDRIAGPCESTDFDDESIANGFVSNSDSMVDGTEHELRFTAASFFSLFHFGAYKMLQS